MVTWPIINTLSLRLDYTSERFTASTSVGISAVFRPAETVGRQSPPAALQAAGLCKCHHKLLVCKCHQELQEPCATGLEVAEGHSCHPRGRPSICSECQSGSQSTAALVGSCSTSHHPGPGPVLPVQGCAGLHPHSYPTHSVWGSGTGQDSTAGGGRTICPCTTAAPSASDAMEDALRRTRSVEDTEALWHGGAQSDGTGQLRQGLTLCYSGLRLLQRLHRSRMSDAGVSISAMYFQCDKKTEDVSSLC